jgi:DNA polymerase-3 subunit delta'
VKEKIIERINKMSSSFIFHGPKGCGKKHLAFDIAKTMLCSSETKPCNTCDECRKVDEMNHVNIIFVHPHIDPEDKKSKRKGMTIAIDDVREQIIDQLIYTPGEKGKRFIIIDQAHRLNKESANALLKSLEEPPADTIFFLLTHNLHSFLPTIISRCQIVGISPLNRKELAKILDIPSSHFLIDYAGGSATALKFYLNNENTVKELIDFVNSPKKPYNEIRALVEQVTDMSTGDDENPIAKAEEFENLEYTMSLIETALLKSENVSYINKAALELNSIFKKIYQNTSSSTVFENMLLELSRADVGGQNV